MANRFKIGVIGVGLIGEVHVQAYKAMPEIEIAAICELDETRLNAMKNQYDIPAGYTNMKEMLEKEALEGVLIATPDNCHLAPVKAAADAGIPFLLEKPIATTIEDANEIIRLAEVGGVPALQGISIHFFPIYAQIRERWLTGEFGQAHTIYAARMLNISEARRFIGRCSVNDFVACHDFHFLLSILGPDVESVYAQQVRSRVYEETGLADSYWNIIRWKNGASASVLMSWAMPSAFGLYQDHLLIIGSKGSLEKPPDQKVRYITDDKDETIDPDPNFTGYEEFQNQMLHFRDVVRRGVKPLISLRDGLRVQKLVWAAEESSIKGMPVQVDL